MTPADVRFAVRMMTLRKACKFSQAALAERLTQRGFSCHQQTVARIERGSRSVSIGEAIIIAEALGTDLPSLIEPGIWASQIARTARIGELERAVAAAQRLLSEVAS